MATVSGIISTTGVGGLTLGGGHGHLTRKYGLTIDNLLSADVVLADGSFVTASEDQHADLFWALRGGGGNFGVVTSFLFRLHPVDHVVAGPMLWSIDDAATIMRAYRDFLPAAPEELNGFFTFMKVPPAPNFPSQLHGQTVCGILWCGLGSQDEVHRLIEPMRSVRAPLLEHVVTMPYPTFQSAFDELYPPGLQWYWKGDFVETLSDEAIALHVRHGSELPTMHSTMHLYPVDGAANRVGASDTAFSYREAIWSKVIVGVDPDPGKAEGFTQWARDYWSDLHPHTLGGAYVNFMMGEGPDRIKATYRDNYDRLVEIKRRYDPDNFFRMNQNIDPAG
jgi:FAD/FMN-containing dehydrogenase